MKKAVYFVSMAILLSNCTSENTVEENKTNAENFNVVRPLVEVDNNGVYKEWYPGFKQLKFTGVQDKDGKRNGVWKMYSESGKELSITEYKHGKKDGISVVYHPNGVLHYRGEYTNDEKTGLWKVYDINGVLQSEVDYSKM